jgi:pimeloyl-ACP methyl ester carboxylesterase
VAVNNGADFVWWATEKMALSVLIRFVGVRSELVAGAPEAEQQRVMTIIRDIEPLSLRVSGLNIDSNPKLGPLPLENVRVPTLIVSTRDDLFNTLPAAEYAARGIPHARLIVYDTGGHLMVGRQQQVRRAIRDFLAASDLVPEARPCEAK